MLVYLFYLMATADCHVFNASLINKEHYWGVSQSEEEIIGFVCLK